MVGRNNSFRVPSSQIKGMMIDDALTQLEYVNRKGARIAREACIIFQNSFILKTQKTYFVLLKLTELRAQCEVPTYFLRIIMCHNNMYLHAYAQSF